ncbi:MAG: FtsW/RodA/SpoVE family cell cycle protein [Lachnospiraceae bacterium]|nr:FtsW/RodA/SpoVE family cell cycle protein [Lachnospiraceae bacterium]
MALLIVENSKYIILILFLCYLLGCVIQNKTTDIMQKILIYVIHFFGFLCLLLRNVGIQLIGFYLLQLLMISGILIGYQLIYKNGNPLLTNHICMFFVISMTVLTRISFGEAFRQYVFWVIGVCGMMIIPVLMKKENVFRRCPVIYAVVGIVLLGLVVLIGATSYGAKLHLNIGPISFQPSEFVKAVFIIFIAAMLFHEATIKKLLITSVLSAIFVLLLVASRDLGGALLYFTTYLMMIYVVTRKKRYLGVGAVCICLAAVAGYFMFSHVRTRVFAWLTPLADFDKKGYQICQSLFGIGTGGWFGFGIGEGKPTLIPIVEKDFIFSAISEEFGAIFGIGLILLTLSTFWGMIHTAKKTEDSFYKYICVGLGVMYATQVILTIGGAIKFIPSTGVTLPLVSYGGSSLLASLLMFGIVQGIAMKSHVLEKTEATLEKESDAEVKGGKCSECSLVFYIFTAIFVAMILYFLYFMIFESSIYIYSEYNKLMR